MHVGWPFCNAIKKNNSYFHLMQYYNAWPYNLYLAEARMDISQKLLNNSETM